LGIESSTFSFDLREKKKKKKKVQTVIVVVAYPVVLSCLLEKIVSLPSAAATFFCFWSLVSRERERERERERQRERERERERVKDSSWRLSVSRRLEERERLERDGEKVAAAVSKRQPAARAVAISMSARVVVIMVVKGGRSLGEIPRPEARGSQGRRRSPFQHQ